MLVSMCLSDKEPPLIEAYWAGTTYVVLNIGGISLYVEPGQLDRLIAVLTARAADRPLSPEAMAAKVQP